MKLLQVICTKDQGSLCLFHIGPFFRMCVWAQSQILGITCFCHVLKETLTLQPQNLYFRTGLSVLRARFFASLFSSPSELSVDQTSRAPVALSSISSHREARTWPSGFASFLLFWLIFSFQWFHRYILLERNFFSDILKWCKCKWCYWHPVTFFTCFFAR